MLQEKCMKVWHVCVISDFRQMAYSIQAVYKTPLQMEEKNMRIQMQILFYWLILGNRKEMKIWYIVHIIKKGKFNNNRESIAVWRQCFVVCCVHVQPSLLRFSLVLKQLPKHRALDFGNLPLSLYFAQFW